MVLVNQQVLNNIAGNSGKRKINKGKKVNEGSWWEAIEIIGERKKEYKVSWAGIDPKTGRRYEPCWVLKRDCTEELVNTWERRHKRGKIEKGDNMEKKEGNIGDKYKKRKVVKEYGREKSSEKKYKNSGKKEENISKIEEKKEEKLGIVESENGREVLFSSIVNSQSNTYFESFESLDYTQERGEIIESDTSVCEKSDNGKIYSEMEKTYDTLPIKIENRIPSINLNMESKYDTLEMPLEDISMGRIFSFSEFSKKSLNIEKDQDILVENTVSSIYHMANDNNIKTSSSRMDIFSKQESIDNISNVSYDKYKKEVNDKDEKTSELKEKNAPKTRKKIKKNQCNNVSKNYNHQQLESPSPSEKVSTWLSNNESIQLVILNDSHDQTYIPTTNAQENQSNNIEYNYLDSCISIESESLSRVEKENISMKPRIYNEGVSEGYNNNASIVSSSDDFIVSLRSVQNKPHIYFFGIEMNKTQRNMYLQLILQYNDLVQEFCSAINPDKTLIKKAQRFINILTMLTIHPYLIFKDKIEKESLGKIELENLVYSSPKFIFLATFLEKSKNLELVIGISSDNEMLLDLIEILVQKLNILYIKTNQYSENININKNIKVLLIAYGKGKGGDVEIHSDIVICIYTSTHILSIRNFNYSLDDKTKNHIIPITINSVEHIQLSVMKDIPQVLYFQNVVKITILLRKFAGVLPSNQFFSNESSQLVYNWIKGNYKDKWMLPRVSDLRELAITLSHKDNRLISEEQLNYLIELEEKIYQHDNYLFKVNQEMHETFNLVSKSNSFDSSDKKILEDLSSQFEISQLRSNVCNFSGDNRLNCLTLSPEPIQKSSLGNTKVSDDIKTGKEPLYLEINNLKNNLFVTQNLLKNTEIELSSFKVSTDRLQRRYEEMQEQYRNLSLEFKNIVNIKNELQKRLNNFQENFIHTQKKVSSSSEIEKLGKRSLTSENQEKISTNTSLVMEKEYLSEENSRLKKIIENKTFDFEFLRSQYQEASLSALNLANEVKQLEAENILLKNKAEGEALRLKEIMIQLLEKKLDERIEELEIQNSLYLKQLKQKMNDESTKHSYSYEDYQLNNMSRNTKMISRQCLIRNINTQSPEDLNGHSTSEIAININEL
ncbi:hypothetical protein T552_00963 [Pneumocystis carinii B80]|uniref:Chromo domain-containing protein n=1 Tax=Pneumocystis carinii (strain B80) TaxID=1408658 RepID=A0A0W4ZN15_PNEC8|nr:hypothetical protein T552_00963 [Pneumocystis carinii B80]KTW29756.1 hypothetical protein T552_00963 [Pneumocystis carinii B80]